MPSAAHLACPQMHILPCPPALPTSHALPHPFPRINTQIDHSSTRITRVLSVSRAVLEELISPYPSTPTRQQGPRRHTVHGNNNNTITPRIAANIPPNLHHNTQYNVDITTTSTTHPCAHERPTTTTPLTCWTFRRRSGVNRSIIRLPIAASTHKSTSHTATTHALYDRQIVMSLTTKYAYTPHDLQQLIELR